MSTHYETGPAAGEYGVENENQLQPQDTLIERGIDDVLDEGYSPPERLYGRGAFGPSESMDQLLAEEEHDPASRVDVILDADEQQRSDDAEREAEFPERREVGRARAGRLRDRTHRRLRRRRSRDGTPGSTRPRAHDQGRGPFADRRDRPAAFARARGARRSRPP